MAGVCEGDVEEQQQGQVWSQALPAWSQGARAWQVFGQETTRCRGCKLGCSEWAGRHSGWLGIRQREASHLQSSLESGRRACVRRGGRMFGRMLGRVLDRVLDRMFGRMLDRMLGRMLCVRGLRVCKVRVLTDGVRRTGRSGGAPEAW